MHENIDPLNELHEPIWDSVHFYFYHLFQLGLRQRTITKAHGTELEYDHDDVWRLADHEMNRGAAIW